MKLPAITSRAARTAGLLLLSGALSILIFPAFNLEWLAWVAFIPLFVALEGRTPRNAFWLGWLLGMLHFLGTLYWVTIAMSIYGGISVVISAGMLVLMCMVLAVYIGAFGLIIQFTRQHTAVPLIVVAPTTWAALEYLRSFFFIPFPWNLLGYSQFLTPSVTQLADVTGVYGVSFCIIAVNAGLYTLLFTRVRRPAKIRAAVVTLGCCALFVGYSAWRLSAAPPVSSPPGADAQRMRFAVIQGNIDQSHKWDAAYRQDIIATYRRLSEQALPEAPELIVWPETAVPFFFGIEQYYTQRLLKAVQALDTHLLFGGPRLIPKLPPEPHQSSNSAFLVSPNGLVLSRYDKIQLVPFGEYIPFRRLLFFVEKMVEVIGDVQPGDTYQVMSLHGKTFSTLICFEIIFPNLVRKFVDRGAQFLITITNDAWYGKTAAPSQHFAMATFRAIENRVALVRSANTGISGFVDAYGRILEQSDIFVEAVLVHTLSARRTTTFYTRYGDLFARVCAGLTALWIGLAWHKRRRQS